MNADLKSLAEDQKVSVGDGEIEVYVFMYDSISYTVKCKVMRNT